jgi:hypothetical protein
VSKEEACAIGGIELVTVLHDRDPVLADGEGRAAVAP